jgi:hypothetical protein
MEPNRSAQDPRADGRGQRRADRNRRKTATPAASARTHARTQQLRERRRQDGRPTVCVRLYILRAAMAKALTSLSSHGDTSERATNSKGWGGPAACVGACVRVCLCPLSHEHARGRVNVHYECVRPMR